MSSIEPQAPVAREQSPAGRSLKQARRGQARQQVHQQRSLHAGSVRLCRTQKAPRTPTAHDGGQQPSSGRKRASAVRCAARMRSACSPGRPCLTFIPLRTRRWAGGAKQPEESPQRCCTS